MSPAPSKWPSLESNQSNPILRRRIDAAGVAPSLLSDGRSAPISPLFRKKTRKIEAKLAKNRHRTKRVQKKMGTRPSTCRF
jgi:hypothetical protein